MRRYYLDDNATTALDPRVRAVMEPLLGAAGNASSMHAEGRRARGAVDSARDAVADWLGAKPSEIIFTGGGTESCNLAVRGLARAQVAAGRARHLVASPTEHHAVLRAVERLEREGFSVTWLKVDDTGRIDPADLEYSLRPETALVTIMSANNETGVVQPMRELGAICRRHDVLFHTDAVQSVGKEPVEREAWGVDALSLAAHKFHGPAGAGVLWLRAGTAIERLMEGGAQEDERRPGTENVAAIAGLAEALQLHGTVASDEARRQTAWTEQLWRRLAQLGGVRRHGHAEHRLPNTLHVGFAGVDGEELLMGLDLAGLAVSSGSACLVGSVQPSHVLAAMGFAPDHAAVRFSIGSAILDDDLPEIVRRVGEVVQRQRALRAPSRQLEAAA